MAKPGHYVDNSGSLIILGAKLDSGGEGDVYELQAPARGLVAKIYRHPPGGDKEQKLRTMVEGCDDNLKRISAWPISTLHLREHGPICGFLMPKVTNYEPIHKLYGPAHRKQLFPKADWEFLINVARNVAAAFGTIHSHGHVIGDVNERNLFIATNTVVKLIDCDSFQITSRGKTHLCEVGTSHFTPPELQNMKSFRERPRTTNHDNFGLAILCFHILFMGRHPFSGVYTGREDMPIEKAIAGSRFAFGKSAALKGMARPPNCVTMEIVPTPVSYLFERAFSELSANLRPSPSQWVGALDYLRHNLRTCSQDSMHKFFGGLTECPWCRLECQSSILFFLRIVTPTSGHTSFDLQLVWQRILSISSPGDCPVIDPSQFSTTPKPLSDEIRSAIRTITAKTLAIKSAAVVIFVGTIAVYEPAFFLVPILAVFLYTWTINNEPLRRERTARQAILNEAQRAWDYASRIWAEQAAADAFKNKLSEFERLKRDHENSRPEYDREKAKLQLTVRQRQLHKFLNSYFINDHTIPNIGPGRKATLVSFGVETAADIDQRRIQKIRGFGSSLTNELVQWRKKVEANFVFDASKGIDPVDMRALDQKYRQQQGKIENALLAGPDVLGKLRAEIMRKRGSLRNEVENAARTLAQARSNMTVFQ
jgi:DNA-binding helix-hairpin-helix protein with protein kinase domain